MNVFNRYIIKNLLLATVFITATLSAVIILTQSLRFLELIIESGADTKTFWLLTFLALPRFWEVIIPIALMIATTFTYNRLKDTSELVIMRSTGFSPFKIARPAILLGLFFTTALWGITLWGTPQSLNYLQKLKQIVSSQFSVMLLHENVFNRIGKDFIVYVQKRDSNGSLSGVVIHDQSQDTPSTILAKHGQLSEQDGNYQVIVYDGSRQVFDTENNVLQRLNFERYIIDLPLTQEIKKRWKEPDERSLEELLHPNPNVLRDVEHTQKFKVELHRRLCAPLLALAFTLIAASSLILGPVRRHQTNWRTFYIIMGSVIIQGMFIGVYNYAQNNAIGIIAMYAVPLLPIIASLYLLSPIGEKSRRKLLYTTAEAQS